jgi:undecaprenyl-diphosphatase
MQAVMLGIIQGLTEFLPISSSGHLVLFQRLFGITEPALFFNISVHVGTLLAVILFFRKEIQNIIGALIGGTGRVVRKEAGLGEIMAEDDVRMGVLIVVGSVPTAILGLLFNEAADLLFSSVAIVGWMLIVTGTFLWITRWVSKEGEGMEGLATRNAFIIGTVQGLAILPGISRSGATISAGLFLGLNRETAARYSFLLSIPAILGAEMLALKDVTSETAGVNLTTLAGAVTAAITGYCALVFLLFVIRKGRLHMFAPYCWLVGAGALILGT